nr:hypothetical protein GCM10020063_051240 [Dactylosporangium thailandense]
MLSAVRPQRAAATGAGPWPVTVLRDLGAEGEPPASPVPPFDESLLGRLETAVTRFRRQRAVIVIDNAERLLNQDRRMTDLALDESLEALATRRHRIKVVLITNAIPKPSSALETWLPGSLIEVHGLPSKYFNRVVRERSGAKQDSSARLADGRLRTLCQNLGGRPRLAEIFDAIIDSDDGDTAESLALEVRAWVEQDGGAEHVDKRLLDRLRRTFRPARARVYDALAAFATPVSSDDVACVVNSEEPELDSRRIGYELERLSRHVVREVDGRYFLPGDEAQGALDWTAADSAAGEEDIRWLLAAAAVRLAAVRASKAPAERVITDTDLAELDAWLRAKLTMDAYHAIEAIDIEADQGWPSPRLRSRREAVADEIAEYRARQVHQFPGAGDGHPGRTAAARPAAGLAQRRCRSAVAELTAAALLATGRCNSNPRSWARTIASRRLRAPRRRYSSCNNRNMARSE